LLVDGNKKPILAGRYSGAIVIQVNKKGTQPIIR